MSPALIINNTNTLLTANVSHIIKKDGNCCPIKYFAYGRPLNLTK